MDYNQPYGEAPNTPYVNGDPSVGRQGSIPPAAALEYPQRELVGLIADTGLTPDNTKLHQVALAIQGGKLTYAPVTGTANALIVTLGRAPEAYVDGMEIRVKIAAANTGAATINVNGLGTRPIVDQNGAALSGGELVAGMVALLIYDGSSFQVFTQPSVARHVQNGDWVGTDDTGSVNALAIAPAPVVRSYVTYQGFRVKVGHTNTGPATLNVGGLGAKAITDKLGNTLVGGELVAGTVVELLYDGTQFRTVSASQEVGSYFVASTSGYSVSAGVDTVIGGFSLSANRLRDSTFTGGNTFTCGPNDAGVWLFSWSGYTTGDNTQTLEFAEIFKNGTWKVRCADAGVANTMHDKSVSWFGKLAAGDTVTVGYYYTPGTAVVSGEWGGVRIGG